MKLLAAATWMFFGGLCERLHQDDVGIQGTQSSCLGPTKYRSKSSYHDDRNITTKADINLFTPRDRNADCLQNANATRRPSPSEEQVRKDRTNKLATSLIRRDSVWRVGGFVVATLYLVAVVSKVWLFLVKRFHLESSFVRLHSNLAGCIDCRPRGADVTHKEARKMGADGTVVHGHGWHLNDDNHITVAGCTNATPI